MGCDDQPSGHRFFTKVRSHGGISCFKTEGKNVTKKPPRQHSQIAYEEAAIYVYCPYASDALGNPEHPQRRCIDFHWNAW